jgi:dimethylaniline monooxygenase (N-oxide forming)
MKKITTLAGIGILTYFSVPFPAIKAEGEPYRLLPKATTADNPNRHILTTVPGTIGIIGGGISGCITAKTLSQQGYSVEVLDKNPELGGLWFGNYDGSGLQFPYAHYDLPDFTFPKNTEEIPKSAEVKSFIEAYAEKFNLKSLYSFNTTVNKIKQNQDLTWTVSTSKGEKKYDFLIICTGPYNKPYMPDFKGAERFQGTIVHSSQFVNAESLCKGKKVVVIGSGKSAFDILAQAKKYEADVSIIVRQTHWLIPVYLKILGLPFGYFGSSRLAGLFLDPFYEERSWKDSFFSFLAPLYWEFVSYFIKKGIPDKLMPINSYKKEKLYRGGARDENLYKEIGENKIPLIKGSVDFISEKGIVINNEFVPADVIVCATGFERNYMGLEHDFDGLWLYRNTILPNIKNLAVVGIVNTYCNPLYTNIQAVWLAEVLRGRVRLPSEYKMTEDIRERKEYTRSLISGETTIPFSWFPYPLIDQFLRDMGLPIERKKNKISYWVHPIKPLDYKEVVTHRV